MGILRQMAEYLYLKKPDPNQQKSDWMKYMHGINRISIFVFLFAMLLMLFRWVILPLFK
jgi:nitrate/nitrite-specific signal transduction histidine kinase